MIFCARAGPMPGSVSSWSALALLMSISPECVSVAVFCAVGVALCVALLVEVVCAEVKATAAMRMSSHLRFFIAPIL